MTTFFRKIKLALLLFIIPTTFAMAGEKIFISESDKASVVVCMIDGAGVANWISKGHPLSLPASKDNGQPEVIYVLYHDGNGGMRVHAYTHNEVKDWDKKVYRIKDDSMTTSDN